MGHTTSAPRFTNPGMRPALRACVIASIWLVGATNLRAQYLEDPSPPGIHLMISAKAVRVLSAEPVDQTGPVSMQIDRYQIEGTGHLTAEAYAEPLPSADGVQLRLTLVGHSSGIGRSSVRSIQLHTQSCSQVCVQQNILVTPHGISASQAAVHAPSRSHLLYVETSKPLVRGLMTRGMARLAFRMQPQRSAQIATQVAETSLSEQMQRESRERLAQANEDFRNRFLESLKDFDFSADDLRLQSTQSAVFAQLNSPNVPAVSPAPHFAAADLAVRVHQDVLNRFFEQALGGTKHTGKPLEADLADLYKSLNLKPMPEVDPRPWSITLAKRDPVTVRFDRDQAEVVIRGAAYTIELDEYPAMNVIVRYVLMPVDTGWKAVRSIPTVQPPEGQPGFSKQLSRKQITLVMFLARKFSDLFPREIDFRRLPLPEGAPRQLQGHYTRVHAERGWLLNEWNLDR